MQRSRPSYHLQQRQQCWQVLHSTTFQCNSHNIRSSSSSSGKRPTVAVHSLPRIADFIRDECPIRGLNGTFREQPVRPGTELQDSAVLQMHEESLLVPGQRQLMYVHTGQLEQIIQDQGRAVLACLQNPAPGGSTPKLLSPARGSWAVAACVGGVQRLPGSDKALVRLLVTDRVAVQALNSPSPNLVLARSAQLRDRWCYFVRTAALEQHLTGSNGRSDTSSSSSSGSSGDASNGSSSGSNGGSSNGAGRDVLNAAQQVQDAATELLQLLQQMCCSVQQVTDADSSGSSSSKLQQQLVQHEAAEELAELLSWCEMQDASAAAASAASTPDSSSSSSSSSSPLLGLDGLLPADDLLMERAWRLSFAPFAAKGLATALGVDVETGKSSSVSSSSSEVLEMMDLGLRLEAASELGQALRQKLAARLSLESLQG